MKVVKLHFIILNETLEKTKKKTLRKKSDSNPRGSIKFLDNLQVKA
jgi:hypothetical protein